MSNNPSLGDGVGQEDKGAEKIQTGFFQASAVPSTLATEKPLVGRWRCVEVPKRHGTRIQYYKVWNVTTHEVFWVGRNRRVGEMLQERLSGWQEALYFPPPQEEPAPAIAVRVRNSGE